MLTLGWRQRRRCYDAVYYLLCLFVTLFYAIWFAILLLANFDSPVDYYRYYDIIAAHICSLRAIGTNAKLW